jgi:hypothetical protein
MYAESKRNFSTQPEEQQQEPQQPESQKHGEGSLAKMIEQQTAQLPSDTYLWAAVGSMGVSAVLQLFGAKQMSNFVGLWAPCFLMFGLYNKMVKLLGSEPETT